MSYFSDDYWTDLDHGVQLVFELERLEVVHVAIAVEEVSLEEGPRFLLRTAGLAGLILVVPGIGEQD